MRKTSLFYLFLVYCTIPVYAEDENPQCQMIAHLTADYYQHRLNGLSQSEIAEQYRPPFNNAEFQRTTDLAIAMAFSLPTDKDHSTVVAEVYDSCMTHR